MTRGVLVVALLALSTSHAYGESGAWNGFRALGVPDAQLAVLDFVTVEAMRTGGLVDGVVHTKGVAERCASSVACHCESMRKGGQRFGAFGSMGRLGDLWTIELTLIDAHTCSISSTQFASESLTDADVPAKLTAMAQRLMTPPQAVAETATGIKQTVDTTPAIVTTFTRAQLRAFQIRTLDDLIPLVAGYDVIDANWGGLVLAQGLPNTLLLLSNGIPLVNGLNPFRWLGRDFRSSMSHIDRIEFVRGPGAVVWGQNALLGVMNLISDIPQRREPLLEAGLAAGTLNTQELWVRGGQNRGRYAFMASVDAGRRIGPTSKIPDSPQAVLGVPAPIPFGNGGTTEPEPDLWLDALVRVGVGKHVVATIQNLTNDYRYEIASVGPLLDADAPGRWQKTHRLYGLEVNHPLYEAIGAKLTGSARASRYEYYSDENFAIQPRWPEGPPPTGTGRDPRLGLRSIQGNARPRTANQLDLRVVHELDTEIKSRLTAGLGVLHMHTPTSYATLAGVDEKPAVESISFTPKNFATVYAVALEELTPLPWLALAAGARLQLDKPYSDEESWRFIASFQGGAAVKRDNIGAKLIYAEGYRPPDAVQLFSTVGTKGNPALEPERSRALAAEGHVDLENGFVLRGGLDITRVSGVIVLDVLINDPQYLYEPHNRGTIDLLGAFAGATVSTPTYDGFATYHVAALDETDPVGYGIPVARHTASLGIIWRPLPDLSVFVRGAFASPRRLRVLTEDDPAAYYKTMPTIRSAAGVALADVYAGLDLELSIENPLLLEHDAPYRVDGSVAPLVERRRGTEVFATLRYDR